MTPASRRGEVPAPRVHHDLLHGRDVPLDEESARRREEKHRLVGEVRRLIEAAALLDALECGEAELSDLADEAARLADHLERLPSLARHGGAALAPRGASALDERSPIAGQANPLAPPMSLECDGVRTWGHATFGPAYEGPPLHVHGGWVIAMFDELLGVAQATSGQPGMTGTITVRLERPTPLGRRIDYEAGVDRVEGRKVFARGEARLDGEVLARAEAVFIAPRNWAEAMSASASSLPASPASPASSASPAEARPGAAGPAGRRGGPRRASPSE